MNIVAYATLLLNSCTVQSETIPGAVFHVGMFLAGTVFHEKFCSRRLFAGYILDVLPLSPGSGEGMPDRTAG